MYPDPPMATKPAIRADKAEFTVNNVTDRKSKENNMFAGCALRAGLPSGLSSTRFALALSLRHAILKLT